MEQLDEEEVNAKAVVVEDEGVAVTTAEVASTEEVAWVPDEETAMLLTSSQLPGEAGELELIEPPYWTSGPGLGKTGSEPSVVVQAF